jgi:hypothetical protein
MPYVQCFGACIVCHRLFSFNPYRVPSVRVRGDREPVCASCLAVANRRRADRGLEPIVALPGAYDPELEGDEEIDDEWHDNS